MKTIRLDHTPRMVLVSLLFLLCLGLHAQTGPGVPVPTGSGKALYVAPTGGNDAYTREQNDLGHPWATPHRAWYQARPGDVVHFRGGTYSPTTAVNTKFYGYNGTAENRIIFTNYPGEIAIIDGANVVGGANNGEVLSIQKDYNSVIGTKVGGQCGFQFINYVTAFFLGEDIGGAHFTVEGCRGIANRYGDNTGFVWQAGDYLIVKNCKISGSGTTGHLNTAGIFSTRARHLKILNNEIDNCVNGIYYKHPNDTTSDVDIEIAHNYVFNCLQSQLVCSKANIHNNIFTNTVAMGVDGGTGPGLSLADYNIIRNNTFYSLWLVNEWASIDPLKGANYNIITNNIFLSMNSWHEYNQPSPGYDFNNTTNFNLYAVNIIRQDRVSYTLQGWRDYQLNTHSRIVDANSLTGTPAFVGGATPATIAGFALAAGSPGKNAGSDGKDMGADVSKVGIQPLATLTITSPNGGEAWRRGESRSITWTSSGLTGNVVIELVQNDTTVGIIATGVPPATGSYTWTVGRLADGSFRTGPNLKIRILSADGATTLARFGAYGDRPHKKTQSRQKNDR